MYVCVSTCVRVKLCLGGGHGALDPNLTCLTAELFRSIAAGGGGGRPFIDPDAGVAVVDASLNICTYGIQF